jgi:hypothetical protein
MAMVKLFVDGPLAFPSGILILLGGGALGSGLLVLFTIPEAVCETFIAIYCTSKGFRPSTHARCTGTATVAPGCTTLRHRVEQGLVDVAPHPVHAAFPVCLDDRVACGLVMAEGVLVFGLLATAQVTTGHAQPQRGPGVTDCDAFLTDVGGRADWLDSC